jgi:hypothetical protein
MRGFRIVATTLAATGLASAGLVVGAPVGLADGGAYIDLDRTHYLPGQIAAAETYVAVPKSKQGLLDRGPFSAFLVTGRAWPQEGNPLPDDAIPLGTFSIVHDRGTTFELTARLSIPDVPGDFYPIAFCNDPCTVAGFREPISGYISIVQTEREAALLDKQQRLNARLSHARRDLRATEKELEALRAEFEARERDRAYLAGAVNRLNHALDRAQAASESRPLLDAGGLAGAVAVLLGVISGVSAWRRRRRPITPRARPAAVGGPVMRGGDPIERPRALAPGTRIQVSSAAHGPPVDVPPGPGPADCRRGGGFRDRLDPVRP